MGVRTKTLITVILVSAVVGALVVSVQNPQLFKGQIFEEPEGETVIEEPADGLLPDLGVDLEIIMPEIAADDIEAKVTLSNIGEGSIEGGTPFTYAISIKNDDEDEIEVFSNSDSYSELAPGDAFSFTYPIPRTIYQYSDVRLKVKAVVDRDDTIKESNEGNNEIVKEV